MIRIEKKYIGNKPYYYLSERVKVGNKFKKIQAFLGKTVPKELRKPLSVLLTKERGLLEQQLEVGEFYSEKCKRFHIHKIESTRLSWKYFKHELSGAQYKKILRDFAIDFIFESNAIEGSRLSPREVENIVKEQYIKKDITRREIAEVLNSIAAFDYISSNTFKLNRKSLKILHAILTRDLGIPQGFKTEEIIVNNKETVSPDDVQRELVKLFHWYVKSARTEHPFVRALIFHNRFEHIHPFTDGNGRTGRLILNWMLEREGYGFMLLRNKNKAAYKSALSSGDEGRYQKLFALGVRTYVSTVQHLVRRE